MSQHVRVVPYDPAWPGRYAAEAPRIMEILEDNGLAIYHIGSTAVPGLAAKPIIDMLVVVRDLEEVDAVAPAFEAIGYEYMGEFGIPGRRYLRKGGDERTHQIHIFRADDWANIHRHLAARDYLRGHADERAAYASLKTELAQKFPHDIEGYCDGKDAFVRELEQRALREEDGSWDRLYLAARQVLRPWRISEWIEVGGVAAALLTAEGNVYVGICIDTACSLGMCAERSAIASMITHGESSVRKIIAIDWTGKALPPCGACREFLSQLEPASYRSLEVMLDYEEKRVVTLGDLTPEWWF